MRASHAGDHRALVILLAHGAALEIADGEGNTAILWALSAGQPIDSGSACRTSQQPHFFTR